MPAAPEKTDLPQIRHEVWCRPTADQFGRMRSEVRIEQFDALNDDPRTGRSAPVARVTRCLECGEATYEQIGA